MISSWLFLFSVFVVLFICQELVLHMAVLSCFQWFHREAAFVYQLFATHCFVNAVKKRKERNKKSINPIKSVKVARLLAIY